MLGECPLPFYCPPPALGTAICMECVLASVQGTCIPTELPSPGLTPHPPEASRIQQFPEGPLGGRPVGEAWQHSHIYGTCPECYQQLLHLGLGGTELGHPQLCPIPGSGSPAEEGSHLCQFLWRVVPRKPRRLGQRAGVQHCRNSVYPPPPATCTGTLTPSHPACGSSLEPSTRFPCLWWAPTPKPLLTGSREAQSLGSDGEKPREASSHRPVPNLGQAREREGARAEGSLGKDRLFVGSPRV